MHVTNLTGEEFPLQATITNDLDLNSNQSISLRITSNKVNDLFIDDFAQMWKVTDHDEVQHKIVYAKKKGIGNKLFIEARGIPLFFDEFGTDRIYEEYNEHMTADRCFSLIFANTNFNYVLLDSFLAVQWEGFGKGESKLNLFKRALNRYKAEFRIVGNTIYLESLIGRDTQFMYRHKLNASDITQEIDASGFWTYAKGYGNYDEGDEGNAKLIREYTSPLAQIPGIGVRHAPPIYNGNITTAATMDSQLKTLVDESLKISVSANIHDLRKQGYPLAQPELGDRVFLIDERIKFNEEVRVHHISITRDWRGNVIDLTLTLGSQNIVKRHQADLQTAIDRITDLLQGKIKLPSSVLDSAILIATKALQDAQTELHFTENGILAIDKNDPNLVTIYNSAGIGVSTDGGATFRTAMTGHGIVADLITVGTMLFDRIKGGTLTLGGLENGNGRMTVYNENGEIIADLDAARGGFDELVIGNVISDSVVKRNGDSYELYVNPVSGDDNNDGLTWGTAFETVQRAVDSIPKYNDGNIVINVFTDGSNGVQMREFIYLYGFIGNGSITIDFRSVKSVLDGRISVVGSTCHIIIRTCTVRLNANTNSVIGVWSSARVELHSLKVYGMNKAGQGIFTHTSNVHVRDSEVYDLTNEQECIVATFGSHVWNIDNKGLGRVGLRAHSGGYFSGYGTQPMGSDTAQSLTSGAFTHSTFTEDAGDATPPEPLPPPETTQSWKNNYSETWRTYSGGQWSGSSNGRDVLQGQWSPWGMNKGLWFFGSDIRNVVNGKTIKRIRVRLTRISKSGSSASRNAIIRPHGYASKPSGEPSFLGASHAVGFSWGQSKWVTLPSSFHSYFSSGQAYGIGIYTTSTNELDYMRFTGNAEIEITYA